MAGGAGQAWRRAAMPEMPACHLRVSKLVRALAAHLLCPVPQVRTHPGFPELAPGGRRPAPASASQRRRCLLPSPCPLPVLPRRSTLCRAEAHVSGGCRRCQGCGGGAGGELCRHGPARSAGVTLSHTHTHKLCASVAVACGGGRGVAVCGLVGRKQGVQPTLLPASRLPFLPCPTFCRVPRAHPLPRHLRALFRRRGSPGDAPQHTSQGEALGRGGD